MELVDIYPTLADLCGLTPPADLAGKSLRPLLDNAEAPWDKPAFTQVWRNGFSGHSVRTERYRYTEWDHGDKGAQLYDYSKDPQEQMNVVSDPEYAQVVAELKQLVRKNWENEYRPSSGRGRGKRAGVQKAQL